MHHVQHAIGQARLPEELCHQDRRGRHFLRSFSTKVLPQAIATGNIHNGTITGKLNVIFADRRRVVDAAVQAATAHVPAWRDTPPFGACGCACKHS